MIVTCLCVPLGKPVKRPIVAAVNQVAVFANQRIHEFIIIVRWSDLGVHILFLATLEQVRQVQVIDDILFAAGYFSHRIRIRSIGVRLRVGAGFDVAGIELGLNMVPGRFRAIFGDDAAG